mgnify:CR=1 FL=1
MVNLSKVHGMKVSGTVIHENYLKLQWSCSIGFGELEVYKGKKDGAWHIETEELGKDFANLVFNAWVDSLISDRSDGK